MSAFGGKNRHRNLPEKYSIIASVGESGQGLPQLAAFGLTTWLSAGPVTDVSASFGYQSVEEKN
jgi:hypothetical protein